MRTHHCGFALYTQGLPWLDTRMLAHELAEQAQSTRIPGASSESFARQGRSVLYAYSCAEVTAAYIR